MKEQQPNKDLEYLVTAGRIVDENIDKDIFKCHDKAIQLSQSPTPLTSEQVQDKVTPLNKSIGWDTWKKPERYEKERIRVFKQNGRFEMIVGEEIDVNPCKEKEQTAENNMWGVLLMFDDGTTEYVGGFDEVYARKFAEEMNMSDHMYNGKYVKSAIVEQPKK
jgi:hypothetical protein